MRSGKRKERPEAGNGSGAGGGVGGGSGSGDQVEVTQVTRSARAEKSPKLTEAELTATVVFRGMFKQAACEAQTNKDRKAKSKTARDLRARNARNKDIEDATNNPTAPDRDDTIDKQRTSQTHKQRRDAVADKAAAAGKQLVPRGPKGERGRNKRTVPTIS